MTAATVSARACIKVSVITSPSLIDSVLCSNSSSVSVCVFDNLGWQMLKSRDHCLSFNFNQCVSTTVFFLQSCNSVSFCLVRCLGLHTGKCFRICLATTSDSVSGKVPSSASASTSASALPTVLAFTSVSVASSV